MIDAKGYGARYATRVRINAPQGSTFNGRTGIVARVESDTIFVRLTGSDGRETTLPFAAGELETLR